MRVKLFGLLFLLATAGCSTVTKQQAFPEMYQELPVAILVLPSINNSTAADAPDLYSSTIAEPLSNAGFYVLPYEVTQKILNNEGLTEGAMLKDVPPQRFAEYFGSDAVLYVTIEEWDTNYFVIGGNVTVKLNLALKSSKSGKTLWNYNQQVVFDTSGNQEGQGGGGLGSLLAAVIETAVATAAQDYVPVARSANDLALKNIPYGKYHNLHGQDQDMRLQTQY